MIHAEGAWGPWASHSGVFCHLCLVRLTSSFSTVRCWDPPATPKPDMDSVPTDPNGIRGHCAPVSTKAFYSCPSDVPGHGSTQSKSSNSPFSPPGWGQGPSNSDHGTCFSLLVNMNHRSLQEYVEIIPAFHSVWGCAPRKLERHFILEEFSVVIVLPLNSHAHAAEQR